MVTFLTKSHLLYIVSLLGVSAESTEGRGHFLSGLFNNFYCSVLNMRECCLLHNKDQTDHCSGEGGLDMP